MNILNERMIFQLVAINRAVERNKKSEIVFTYDRLDLP